MMGCRGEKNNKNNNKMQNQIKIQRLYFSKAEKPSNITRQVTGGTKRQKPAAKGSKVLMYCTYFTILLFYLYTT